MTFFYDINKKLQQVLETPKSDHMQLNERDMSRAAKGYEKYGKEGMEALAKAGREGKDLDPVRAKYDKYDNKKDVAEDFGATAALAGGAALGSALGAVKGRYDDMKHRERGATYYTPKDQIDKPRTTMQRVRAAAGFPSKNDPNVQKADEGLGDVVKKVGGVAKKVGGKVLDTLGHGSDEDLRKDLQRKMGLPATGEKPRTPLAKEAAAPMSPKQKKFAALAEPKDKITFADKIAGAKKEVDEMLGDVAAEAMKGAVTRKIAGKRYGGAAQQDDEPQAKPAVPRGRGRPKKSTDTEQGAELKPDWSAFGVGKVKLPAHKGNVTKHKLSDKEPGEKVKESATPEDREVLERLMDQAFEEGKNALGNAIQGVLEMMSDGEEELDEKAVSKKQQKFMGMVHAAQKGEKPASKEVAKVAKSMGKKDAKDFAATKHKGLPEKAPNKDKEADKSADKPKKAKKEKTEEAGGSGTPTASSGFGFGKGIYDSMNREIEDMIAESMNVSMNMNNDAMGGPTKSLTVTATDEDAEKLGELLKMAGVGGEGAEACPSCGQASCGCDGQMDEAYGDTTPTENAPEWPTDTETSNDALQYAGGINKPKSTGQTTVPVIASQEERQHSYAEMEEDAIRRMMEMAGMSQANRLDEGVMDKLKSFAVPKLMKLLGPDADDIANAVKQATGGDFTPSKENAIKVARALGIDKAAAQGQPQQMAEGIAGNWQGKLIQSLYTLGLLGSAGAAASMWGTVGGSFMAVIGTLLLMFASVFFGDAPGQVGVMGKFGNKGTDTQSGLDDHGMPVKNTNESEDDDLTRMMEMAGIKTEAKKVEEDDVEEGNKFTGNLAKARAAGKKEADLDGDGDLEKVRESMNNLWKAYKG